MTLTELRRLAEAGKHNAATDKCIECEMPHLSHRHRHGCSKPESAFDEAANTATLLRLLDRIAEAEKVLGFYGDHRNWIDADGLNGRTRIIWDKEGDLMGEVGGKRAREYLRRWEGE
jgi:hypothetical protein